MNPVTTEDVCEVCRALPQVTEDVKWDNDLVFSIGGKMFCVIALTDEEFSRFSFKASPESFAALLDREGIIPAPYMARAQWVQVIERGAMALDEAADLLAQARRLVIEKMPKRAQSDFQ